ncbi:conjugal transfer protein TraX (plasmid) [Salmonella enterica]|nr:conjugal transfer protein TraX [Salmonella enterica]
MCRILSASSGNITDTRLQDASLTEIYFIVLLQNNSKTVV